MDAKPEYLLVKRGLYYRPDNHGYTGIKSRAGRYFERDAHPDYDVVAVHEDSAPEYSDACFRDLMLADVNDKVAKLEAERDALLGVLKVADDAIAEMFRYYDGGETRGSYDGKPERNQLRKAGYATRAAIAKATHTPAGN